MTAKEGATMPKEYCPMCGSATLRATKGGTVCLECETSVHLLNMVTVIRPRPVVTA